MRIQAIVLLIAGAAVGLSSPAAAESSGKHKRTTKPHATRQQAAGGAQSNSQFQGGVLKGPLYNGQDYLGNDPDPNIRSYILRDMGRYGGPD
jgi:hypothetical protein